MDNMLQKVVNYFQEHEKYFWKWGGIQEDAYVVEWEGGATICYLDDLIQLLEFISEDGLPPLGALLMVLAAAKGDWKSREEMVRQRFAFEKDIRQHDLQIYQAFSLLQDVEKLPKKWRSGNNRALLLSILFRDLPGKITGKDAIPMIEVFKSGRLDNYIFKPGILPAMNAYMGDTHILAKAKQNFPDVQTLEDLLRTGMKAIPSTPEIALPEDLLEQLKMDGRTAGIASLTHHLIAALNIPQRTTGSSDQLFGGVSDITNRGNLDRLLLSELAHDDISLMARLANNEALYLRREDIPAEQHHHRVILLDTTIRMWGHARIFGIAAALACARNNKAKRIIKGGTLGGNSHLEMDLDTKDGIMEVMEQLDVALDCGDSLTTTMHDKQVSKDDEYFLVTATENLQQPEFLQQIAALKRSLDFMIAVDREGNMQCWEFIKGRKKLWSQSKFDLGEIMQPKKDKKKYEQPADIPYVLKLGTFPLYFPSSKVKLAPLNTFEIDEGMIVSVTHDKRLLYWENGNRGAKELMQKIEGGQYRFGLIADNLFILVFKNGEKGVKLYRIKWRTARVTCEDLPIKIPVGATVFFKSDNFLVGLHGVYHQLQVVDGAYRLMNDLTQKKITELNVIGHMNVSIGKFKSLINCGYSAMNNVKTLYINQSGELTFDKHYLCLEKGKGIFLHEKRMNVGTMIANIRAESGPNEVKEVLENDHIKIHRFAWKDGSEAWADSRGLLHLVSSDKQLPEITIVLVMGIATACWSSNGRFAGNLYFTGTESAKTMDMDDFYHNYIQRFIDALR